MGYPRFDPKNFVPLNSRGAPVRVSEGFPRDRLEFPVDRVLARV